MSRIIFLIVVVVLAGCGVPAPPSYVTSADTAKIGDATRGETIFRHGVNGAPPCVSCHALKSGAFSLAPVMIGISERAGTRIEGINAEAYLHQSILEPNAFIVTGYRSIMYPDYAKHFSEQDIADLVAFLLTQ